MVLRLPISPEGIARLARLGWAAPRDCHHAAAVTDAVIHIADAALDTGLRPSWRPLMMVTVRLHLEGKTVCFAHTARALAPLLLEGSIQLYGTF
jgi:hypothetical protein